MSIAKFGWFGILGMALCLMSACANGDVQRVQKAEELLTVNRDSEWQYCAKWYDWTSCRKNQKPCIGFAWQTYAPTPCNRFLKTP